MLAVYRIGLRILAAVLFAVSMQPLASAQRGFPPQGTYNSVRVGGGSLTCIANGRIIPVSINYNHNGLGTAHRGRGFTTVNPGQANNQEVFKFVLAHECAHHILGRPSVLSGSTETQVDCLAIRMLRNNGLVTNRRQLLYMVSQIQNWPGSNEHLPGAHRSRVIQNCFYN